MSSLTVESHISLIDLSKQLPFEIDAELKKQLCFAETLVISCGHYEGEVIDAAEAEDEDSDWSCQDSTSTEISKAKSTLHYEVKDRVEEEEKEKESSDDEKDFHFFFFPDCKKPLPSQDSKASVVIVDGFPKINEAAIDPIVCTCNNDPETGQCSCVTKLPCTCGATTKATCTCEKLKGICICHGEPQPVCTCKESKVCLCHPDGKPRPTCTCEEIEKPCVCHPDKFPFRECECKHKPRFLKRPKVERIEEGEESQKSETEVEGFEGVEEISPEQQPCECQKPEPKPHCLCLKGQECICNKVPCICGVRKTCVCEPTDSQEPICKDSSSKSICSCDESKGCSCDHSDGVCSCFPKQKLCTCGDPENCRCQTDCDCTNPCLCTDLPKEDDGCVCFDKDKQPKGFQCTCPTKPDGPRKLKRVRAGKHGYRWCNEVDPHHTFFGYGYGRHDKISYKEQLIEKVNIMGLHDEKKEEEVCAVHGVKAPPYKKQVRKPSLDCCSAVGGISISVETLGEDNDKFLVQVVSHSSKEGAKTGSRIVSILDMNFHTMEENRTEYITQKDRAKERRSYMAICENGYYNKITCICGDRNVIKRHYHSFKDSKNFLLEGANVVLMRFFGLRRYRGTVKTDTVLIGGQICESIYVSLGVSQAVVNGKPLFVVKVERHIIEPSGSLHQTLTVLTLRDTAANTRHQNEDALPAENQSDKASLKHSATSLPSTQPKGPSYMVSHEWADNAYILHLNPLLNIVPEKDEIEPHAPLRESWRDDLQLFSDYLDYKSARTSEGGRYAEESGALTATIRDYLQALLLLKPTDALHFTRHYFGSAISALDLPHNEYFDPGSKRVHYFFFEE